MFLVDLEKRVAPHVILSSPTYLSLILTDYHWPACYSAFGNRELKSRSAHGNLILEHRIRTTSSRGAKYYKIVVFLADDYILYVLSLINISRIESCPWLCILFVCTVLMTKQLAFLRIVFSYFILTHKYMYKRCSKSSSMQLSVILEYVVFTYYHVRHINRCGNKLWNMIQYSL